MVYRGLDNDELYELGFSLMEIMSIPKLISDYFGWQCENTTSIESLPSLSALRTPAHMEQEGIQTTCYLRLKRKIGGRVHRYTEAYLFMYIIMIMDWIDLQAESKYVRAFPKSQLK